MAVNSIPRTLVLFRQYAETEVRFEDGPLLAVIHEVVPQDQIDARRLVACWNACDGIQTNELEHIANTGGMLGPREDVARIASQRDELLAELEKIATSVDIDTLRAAIDCARAALSKVKGGAL